MRSLLILAAIISSSCASSQVSLDESIYSVGGVDIIIPAPSSRLRVVEPDLHELLEAFVPNGGRLVVGFADPPSLQEMAEQFGGIKTNARATVGAMRIEEYATISTAQFEEICEFISAEYSSGNWEETISRAESDINELLSSVAGTETPIRLNNPIVLGLVLRRPDAIGYSLIMSGEAMGVGILEHVTSVLIRVHGKLLFINYNCEFDGHEPAGRTVNLVDAWVERILSLNEEDNV